MKRTLCSILIFLLITGISACKDNTQPETVPSTTALETTAQVTLDREKLPILQTAIFNDSTTLDFVKQYHWGNYGYEQNLIWSSEALQNVLLIPITSEDGSSFKSTGLAQYALETLTPGEGIVLDLMIPEGMPSHALTFDFGASHYAYAIGYNGRDGGISFVEAAIDIVPPDNDTDRFEGDFYVVSETQNGIVTLEKEKGTVESSSAWHIWAELKKRNALIPAEAYLNSFTVEGNTGSLDLAEGIYQANVGSEYEYKMIRAIVNTYLDTYDLQTLRLTVNGGTYESGHYEFDHTFSLSDPQ